jgi:hypothetical protein
MATRPTDILPTPRPRVDLTRTQSARIRSQFMRGARRDASARKFLALAFEA